MKQQLLLFVLMMLPLVANAYDIEVQNADGKTIYYNYINDGAELAVTFRGTYYTDYPNEYTGKVVIPEEVTYMNKTCKVTSIGDFTFANCTNLTSVTIPNSVTNIDEYAFYWCPGLTSITIPNSVTSIGEFIFYNCSKLTSITIPNSLTSIGKSAFYEANISTIVSLIENPFAINTLWSGAIFSGKTLNYATLYVPNGTIDKYKATEGWWDFKNIVEGVPSGIKGVFLDNDKDYPVYDTNGVRLREPKKGINIINGKKVAVDQGNVL